MISCTVLFALTNVLSVSAMRLLVASYGPDANTTGAVQTLELGLNTTSLNVTHTDRNCGALPSWLDIFSCDKGSIVTCVNEGAPGSMTMLSAKKDGSLEMLYNTSTLPGPVSSGYFGADGAVALAHVSRRRLSMMIDMYADS
jgi:hypothetical protein